MEKASLSVILFTCSCFEKDYQKKGQKCTIQSWKVIWVSDNQWSLINQVNK